jgi:hypothetical protein
MSTAASRDGPPTTMVAGAASGDGIPTRPLETAKQLEITAMTHEHDTVVVDSGDSSSMGVILGVIGILVLLAAVWFFALGPGASPSRTTNENNNTINPPAASVPAVEPSAP